MGNRQDARFNPLIELIRVLRENVSVSDLWDSRDTQNQRRGSGQFQTQPNHPPIHELPLRSSFSIWINDSKPLILGSSGTNRRSSDCDTA